MRATSLLLVLAACAAPASPVPVLEQASPDHGPLAGGTRIVLAGRGFLADGAAPNRVLIGGREAPLVATLDDATLEVVIPPGERPGDTEVLVFNGRGTATAAGLFRYSAPPAIAGVTPDRVVFDALATVTLTGSGFRDEGAGEVTVLVDGAAAADVTVIDDRTLTFTAPLGRPLARAVVEVIDARGRARSARGYRYVPSARPGLLLFPPALSAFAYFWDPVDGALVPIPRPAGSFLTFTSVVRDTDGELSAVDRSGRFGRLDTTTQALLDPVSLPARVPAFVRVGATLYAIDRWTRRIGRLDPAAGTFEPIGDSVLACCGSYGLAFDGTTLYATMRDSGTITLTTVDPVTGAFGVAVPLVGAPALHVEELRFAAGTLYATSRDGTLLAIDPATGATTVRATLGRFTAMVAFE